MNKQDMTKRVLSGLSHKKAKILAHPTGRLLNDRSGFELDWDKIFDFCQKNDKALEINSWPDRLDLPDSLVKLAVENNVKMIINTDSHAAGQMGLMRFGVSVARRGWATKNDILNTLSYNQFLEWLKK
jgi:DNA polymerase (family 10)